MPVLTTVLRNRKHKEGQRPLPKFKPKKQKTVLGASTPEAWLFAEGEDVKRLTKRNSATIKDTRYADFTRL